MLEPSANPTEGGLHLSAQPGSSKLCTICHERPAIYACPGCAIRSCSLPCSSLHKQHTGCSGQRNKAAYVPMNQYNYGALMNDYVYLEEVGRQVGDWGKEIIRKKLVDLSSLSTRGSSRGMTNARGRGRGRGGGMYGGKAAAKRATLKRQLDLWDIDVDLLSVGMAKAQLNRSSWDFKNKTALLTVEFRLHAPPPLPGTPAVESPFVLMTHQNRFESSLLPMLQRQVAKCPSSKAEPPIPAWVHSLVAPDPDDPEGFVPPLCLMRAKVDSLNPILSGRQLTKREVSYWQMDHAQRLSELLRHKSFVEFPTIDVWPPGEFRGTIVDVRGTIERVFEGERQPKRRKLDVQAGKKAIRGLIGDYGSDSDQEEEREQENSLTTLGRYAESDGEEVLSTQVTRTAEADIEHANGEIADDNEDADDQVDYRVMLESMQASRDEEVSSDGTDEEVNWHDSDNDV